MRGRMNGGRVCKKRGTNCPLTTMHWAENQNKMQLITSGCCFFDQNLKKDNSEVC